MRPGVRSHRRDSVKKLRSDHTERVQVTEIAGGLFRDDLGLVCLLGPTVCLNRGIDGCGGV